MSSIYQEQILDHYHHPRCHGLLPDSPHHTETKNLSCGDDLRMDFETVDGIIKTIGWEGSGCAISQASASLLSEHFVGKTVTEAQNFTTQNLLELLGIELTPARLKCALLSLETLHTALRK